MAEPCPGPTLGPEMKRNRIALTIDVEDYFHVTSFEGQISRANWSKIPTRVEKNVYLILDILSEHCVTATFFVLGWIAVRHPELIGEIAGRGHEVASHGYDHQLIYRQSPEEFREDVRRAKTVLENITGNEVIGYRAPTFSITPRSQWAYSILGEEEYRYSSSVFPVHHDRYGWPGFGSKPSQIPINNGTSIWEFPLPFMKLGKALLPFGGGGYLRIYPHWVTSALMKHKSRDPENLVICYFHPWEIDPFQPRLKGSFFSRLRHYWGLGGCEKKIRKILKTFPTKPLSSYLN